MMTPANKAGPANDAPPPADPHDWVKKVGVATTADVQLPERLIDEVIGQEEAVLAARKAASQKRHLLLIGDPGTGKSMIAKAMAQMLPAERQPDSLCYPNKANPNEPKVVVVEGGAGRGVFQTHLDQARRIVWAYRLLTWAIALGLATGSVYYLVAESDELIFLVGLLVMVLFVMLAMQMKVKESNLVPKLLTEHTVEPVPAPYVDGTGSHAGALLGDVRHDPFQSGGLETPVHERVEIGAIHRSHNGVLFIDEINVLRLESQQALLTAMQEGKYSIVGQSERSSGAMVKTEPVPCAFILVAAGNLDAVRPTDPLHTGMHPALRSRIRGYGYEVYVNSHMPDTHDNRMKLVRFVAQEIRRDGRIPPFDMDAVAEIIREAQRRAGRSGQLTLRLRELGGLVRTSGDIAREENAPLVTLKHVREAKTISRSLEQQITDRDVARATVQESLEVKGELVGAARGLAFLGTGEVGEPAGLVVPVEATVTPAASRHHGSFFLSGGEETEARNLLDNIAALAKRLRGSRISDTDLHLQVLAQERVQVDLVGAAAAVAAVSALESLPVRQDVAVAGMISISGRLRAVPGLTQMVEAAADLGYKVAVVPEVSRDELQLDERYEKRIVIVYARELYEILDTALVGSKKKTVVGQLRKMSKKAPLDAPEPIKAVVRRGTQ